jgi:hypothetical protein
MRHFSGICWLAAGTAAGSGFNYAVAPRQDKWPSTTIVAKQLIGHENVEL